MLINHGRVLEAEANTQLREEAKFLAARMAELLDPGATFSLSGNARTSPAHLIEELLIVAQGFLQGDGTPRETVQEALARTQVAIKRTRHLSAWFPAERSALLQDLLRPSQPPLTNQTESQIRNFVKRTTRQVLGGSVATFAAAIQDPTAGYKARLLNEIRSSASRALSEELWREFDEDLADLAGLLLGEGRDGSLLACSIADAFASAASDADALDALEALCLQPKEQFTVAFVVHGAKDIPNATQFDCAVTARVAARWPHLTDRRHKSHTKLRRFLKHRTERHRSCGILIEAEAFDREHARTLALAPAEELLDQMRAEHRVSSFELDGDAIVLQVSDGTAQVLSERRSGVDLGRTRTRTREASIQEALRYHALSQLESVPVVSVLHSWIALESLALGAQITEQSGKVRSQRPTAFLPDHVAGVVRLTSTRHLLTSTWHVARKRAFHYGPSTEWSELERWLGVRPGTASVDLERWKDVLQADTAGVQLPDDLNSTTTPAEAAVWLELLAPDLGVFAHRRVRMARWIFGRGNRLVNYAADNANRAAVQVGRMIWLRNKAVHNAMANAPSAPQLSRSSYDLVDATFEVLPHWLAGRQPWEALREIKTRAGALTRSWRNANRPTLDTSKLVHEP